MNHRAPSSGDPKPPRGTTHKIEVPGDSQNAQEVDNAKRNPDELTIGEAQIETHDHTPQYGTGMQDEANMETNSRDAR